MTKFVEIDVSSKTMFVEDLHAINSVAFHDCFGDYRTAIFVIHYKDGSSATRCGSSDEESKAMYTALKNALFELNEVQNETTS
ncbi:hypothetical protein NFI00_000197 [Salmonella enterica]|nr:hypothetical protein [Salmonella enterica]